MMWIIVFINPMSLMAIFIHNQVFQLRKNQLRKNQLRKTCYIINTYSIKYLIKELSKEEVSKRNAPHKRI
jgi:hypothetical protein